MQELHVFASLPSLRSPVPFPPCAVPLPSLTLPGTENDRSSMASLNMHTSFHIPAAPKFRSHSLVIVNTMRRVHPDLQGALVVVLELVQVYRSWRRRRVFCVGDYARHVELCALDEERGCVARVATGRSGREIEVVLDTEGSWVGADGVAVRGGGVAEDAEEEGF